MRRYKGWEGHPNYRWTVEYKGVRYRISAHDLNAPLPTAEASYPLFKKWWERKRAEIDAPSPQQQLRDRYKVADLQERIDKAKREMATAQALLHNLAYRPEIPEGGDLLDMVLYLDHPDHANKALERCLVGITS